MSEILVPVSFGELLDKMAILEIKCERIRDAAKLANVQRELDALNRSWAAHPAAAIDIRDKERAGEFDDEFVRLARAVYVTNDERARVKKDINLKLGSAYVEEKSYADYSPPA